MITPGQPPTFSTTDLMALQIILVRLLEPPSTTVPITVASGSWSAADLTQYLDFRQRRLLRETGIVVARLGVDSTAPGGDHSLSITPTQEAVNNLPQNLIDLLRVAMVKYAPPSP